jgi:hypothetical protein
MIFPKAEKSVWTTEEGALLAANAKLIERAVRLGYRLCIARADGSWFVAAEKGRAALSPSEFKGPEMKTWVAPKSVTVPESVTVPKGVA